MISYIDETRRRPTARLSSIAWDGGEASDAY